MFSAGPAVLHQSDQPLQHRGRSNRRVLRLFDLRVGPRRGRRRRHRGRRSDVQRLREKGRVLRDRQSIRVLEERREYSAVYFRVF